MHDQLPEKFVLRASTFHEAMRNQKQASYTTVTGFSRGPIHQSQTQFPITTTFREAKACLPTKSLPKKSKQLSREDTFF